MTAVAVFGFANMQAQEDSSTFGFEEGNIIVEGNVGFSSTKETDAATPAVESKTTGFNISPKVGYFLSDDLAVGIKLGFGLSKTETGSTIDSDVSAVGAGVFARYYFLELGKRFKTYTEFGLGFGTTKEKEPFLGTETMTTNDNAISAGLDIGANYFITENIAVTFGLMDILSISSTKREITSTVANSEKLSSSGTDVSFGLGNVNNPFSNIRFGILFKF